MHKHRGDKAHKNGFAKAPLLPGVSTGEKRTLGLFLI